MSTDVIEHYHCPYYHVTSPNAAAHPTTFYNFFNFARPIEQGSEFCIHQSYARGLPKSAGPSSTEAHMHLKPKMLPSHVDNQMNVI